MAELKTFESEYAEFHPIIPDKERKGFGYYLSRLFRKQDAKKEESLSVSNEETLIEEHLEISTETKAPQSRLQNESSYHSRNSVMKRIRMMMDKGTMSLQSNDNFRQHWLPDRTSCECSYCQEKFTTFRRRHHCRICGQIFCSKCCSIRIPGKLFGSSEELRSCLHCCRVLFSLLQSEKLSGILVTEIKFLRERLLSSLSPEFLANLDIVCDDVILPSDAQGLLHFKKPSYGFIEENYASKTKFEESACDSNQMDRISSERKLLLKDSQQLHSLCSLIFEGPIHLPLSTNRHRLRSFPNSFVGMNLVQWLLDQDKASSKQSAVAIGQALLEAGLIVCVSQHLQFFADDYVIYQPVKKLQQSLFESCEASEEPLWVKEIPSQAESEVKETDQTQMQFLAIDALSSLSTSSSNYCLDLNFKDNVVLMMKPRSNRDDLEYVSCPTSTLFAAQESSASTALSVSAVPVMNDQLTTSGLMSKEVLEAVRGYEYTESSFNSSGWLQHDLVLRALEAGEQMDDQTKLKFQMQQKLESIWSSHEAALLTQILSKSKLHQSWHEIIMPVIYTVSKVVCPDVRNDGDEMDIRQYVHFKKIKINHQLQPHCDIVNGVICSKNVALKSMLKNLTNPMILLIASNIDYLRGNDPRLINVENVEFQEKEYLKHLVSKILSHKPNVVIVEKSVSFYVIELLKDANVTLVINTKQSVMERISRCTQAQILSSADAPITSHVLGMCHNFYLRTYGELGSPFSKTFMFFDGCAMHLGCTIMLRGPSLVAMKKVKRIMYFMIYALYNWKFERSFLMDEHAFFQSLLDDGKKEKSTFLNSQSDGLDISKTNQNGNLTFKKHDANISQCHHLNPEKTTQEFPSHHSDPLHQILEREASPHAVTEKISRHAYGVVEFLSEEILLESLKTTMLSISPLVKNKLPYLLSTEGKNSMLKKFVKRRYYSTFFTEDSVMKVSSTKTSLEPNDTKTQCDLRSHHRFLSQKWTKTAKDLEFQTLLADFRARGDAISNIRALKSQKETFEELRLGDAEAIFKDFCKNELRKERNKGKEISFSAPMLTDEGMLDALHPFNHQRISIMFSVFSRSFQVTSNFCVDPCLITMEFYGKNDIPLGAFLENYCFSSSYSCPSRVCTVACVSHVRKFAHHNGQIEVSIRKIDNPLHENEVSIIYMWNWCKICASVSSVVPMSSETWAFSFAKYLEIRFYDSFLTRRGTPGCSHSVQQEHFHYFAKKNLVAIFKYIPISMMELFLPPPEIGYIFQPLALTEMVDTVRAVAVQGYSVMSLIREHIVKIEMESNSRWTSFINALNYQHAEHQSTFKDSIDRIQLMLASPRKLQHSEEKSSSNYGLYMYTYQIMEDIIKLKYLVEQVVLDWNSKVQEFLQLKKKEERIDKEKSNLGKSAPTSYIHLVQKETDPSISNLLLSDDLLSPKVEKCMNDDNEDISEINPCEAGCESERFHELESFADKISNVEETENAYGASDFVRTSEICSMDTILTDSQSKPNSETYSSDSISLDVAEEAIEKSPERWHAPSTVKNMLTHFWSSSGDLIVKSSLASSAHLFTIPEVKIPITIYEEEITSIVAYALASQEYDKLIKDYQRKFKESCFQTEYTNNTSAFQNELHGTSSSESFHGFNLPDSLKESHIEIQWNDQNANFYCKIYFAEQFRLLRSMIFPPGEEHFIRSLARCINWDAKGGKSGSLFCKTKDERFVIKQMSKIETNFFPQFGPSFIHYVTKSINDHMPTALTKIVGVFRIGFKNNLSNNAQKMDIVIMENLFYQRNIKHKYDLKGSMRNRHVNITGKEVSEVVLLDENLLKMASSSSLYLRSHCKEVLMQAIHNDSSFLSQLFIIDYSLLLGIDEDTKELVVGIIDYIRTFTWDKRLETILKGTVLGGNSDKLPTIISPELYRSRFCQAMEKYFTLMPDKWSEVDFECFKL